MGKSETLETFAGFAKDHPDVALPKGEGEPLDIATSLNEMKTVVIVYHKGCPDGFCAAYCAWKKFGDGAVYIPWAHEEKCPLPVEGQSMYFLDISPKPDDVIAAIACDPQYINILDHHVTARDSYRKAFGTWDEAGVGLKSVPGAAEGQVDVFMDMDHSGAWLAWYEFLSGDNGWCLYDRPERVPQIVRYCEDRDLWKFKLPNSKAIFAWLQSFEMNFTVWDDIARVLEESDMREEAARVGDGILRFKDQQVSIMANHHWWQDICGYRVPVANATAFFSEVPSALLGRFPDAPFAAGFLDTQEGRRWSLRSEDGRVDVSKVAAALGGGGHRNAAGFFERISTMKEPPEPPTSASD